MPKIESTVRLARIAVNIAFAVLLIVGLLSALYLALNWYLRPDNFSERNDLVQTVAAILVGTVGFFGLFFTWRNLNQSRKATEDQLRVAREGQITERFTRAIEQLGAMDNEGKNKRLEIRLGRIYALERIATDSPERDYSTVMQVLMAYVRENCPLDPKKNAKRNQEDNKDSEPTQSAGRSLTVKTKAPADIQAILDVLQRLKQLEQKDLVSKRQPIIIDLKESNLPGANLSEAILPGANLSEAKLPGASLAGANLSKAILTGASLGAFLSKANLSGAFLSEADLSKAILTEADLSEVKNLTVEQLESSRGDTSARLPSGLERPKSWMQGEHDSTNQNDQSQHFSSVRCSGSTF